MELRTVADTIATISTYTCPLPAEFLRRRSTSIFAISRLLRESWQREIAVLRQADQRDTRLLAEEILVTELLMEVVGDVFQRSPIESVRRCGERLVEAHRMMGERIMQLAISLSAELANTLKLERLRRRLGRWAELLIQQQGNDDHGVRLAASSSSAVTRCPDPLTDAALRMTIPNSHCTDALRAPLLTRLCCDALGLIPATLFQSSGVPKTAWQRRIEASDPMQPLRGSTESDGWPLTLLR
ncbi:MAG: hypothetical protein KDA66_04015 [Planctomycetaceae bacterium]|nr:hypothetical protein [Planctomycetaceae bacterium]